MSRWLACIGLLCLELLVVSVAFDTGIFSSRDMGLNWVAASPAILSFVISAVAAFWFLALRKPRINSSPQHFHPPSYLASGFCLFAHLAVYFAIFLCLGKLTSIAVRFHYISFSYAFALACLGLLWLLTALGLVVPISRWPALLRRYWASILAAGLLGLTAWGAGRVVLGLWRPLTKPTFYTVRWLLRAVYPNHIVSTPHDQVLGTSNFQVSISSSCSGVEGIGLITAFLAAYIWSYRRELAKPRALLLFPIGCLAIFLANAGRIAALVAIGSSLSRRIAVEAFHSQAGWLTFNLVSLGLIYVAEKSDFFRKLPRTLKPIDPTSSIDGDSTSEYLAPFFFVLVAAQVSSAFSVGFPWLYPIQMLAGLFALWLFASRLVRSSFRRFSLLVTPQGVLIGLIICSASGLLIPDELKTELSSKFQSGLWAHNRNLGVIWIVCKLIGFVIVTPLVEEFAFRGYLTRRLISSPFAEAPPGSFSWFAFLASSLLFGLMHNGFFIGTIAGMLFAVEYYRRGRLSDAVSAHLFANLFIAARVLLCGDWWLWT